MSRRATASPDLRSLIGPYTEWASESLHQRLPGLEANHLSFVGAALSVAGAIATVEECPPKLSLGLNAAAAITDAFNGALARVCYGDDPDRLARGNKIDSTSDFVKDLSMGMAKIIVAGRSGSRPRRALAGMATITTPLASFSRAYKENQGYKINEHGDSYLEFIGTRAARTAFHVLTSSNISFRGRPLQPALDTLIVTGNLTRISKNLTASTKEEKPPAAQQKARFRSRFHLMSTFVTGAGIFAARRVA